MASSSPSPSSKSNQLPNPAVDQLVFDFQVVALETIIQDRRAVCSPLSSKLPFGSYADNSDYCRQLLNAHWRQNITRPIVVDLYIFNPLVNENALLERWKLSYVHGTVVCIPSRHSTLIIDFNCIVSHSLHRVC
jgi:hypothetical protein